MLSRVADSLYWMGRYLERAEHTARLLDVTFNLMLDEAHSFASRRWRRLLASLQVTGEAADLVDPYAITHLLTFDANQPASIDYCIGSARHNALNVREQISSEMWEQLNRLYLAVNRTRLEDIWDAQPHEFFRRTKEGVHLFQGITDSTLARHEGWQFILVGRSVERVQATATLLNVHYPDIGHLETADFLEWVGLLKFCTAFEAYCKVYTADLRPDRIVEFLVLDGEFPRSIRFAAHMVDKGVQTIAELTNTRKGNRALAVAGRLNATLSYTPAPEVIGNLHPFLTGIQRQCGEIHEAIYDRYINYPITSAMVF
ncbi:MAG TPA: alpha-E domain-containing protein [Candidatus Xenobia bacterium]